MYTSICLCACTYIHTHTNRYTCVHKSLGDQIICIYEHMYICQHMHTYTHKSVCVCVYTHTFQNKTAF